jgi:hypothetical protein
MNYKAEVKGSELIITVNLKGKTEPSKSQKSDVIASTKGNQPVPGQAGVKFGLNVFRVK